MVLRIEGHVVSSFQPRPGSRGSHKSTLSIFDSLKEERGALFIKESFLDPWANSESFKLLVASFPEL